MFNSRTLIIIACLSAMLTGGACRTIQSSPSNVSLDAQSTADAEQVRADDARASKIPADFPAASNSGKLRPAFINGASLANSLAAQNLRQEIDEILASETKASRTGRWGVAVRSNRDGRVLYERASSEPFTPASNMKVYTTAAALDLLGADYRWRTSVYLAGNLDANGVINGDLILYGRGAPDLSSNVKLDNRAEAVNNSLASLADGLARRGVRSVRGRIIADESYFGGDDYPNGWLWDDMQWYYGAQASALSINDNSVLLTVASENQTDGDAPEVKTLPATDFLRVKNDATVVERGRRTTIGVTWREGDGSMRVYGDIPAGTKSFGVRVATPEPARAAAHLLRSALNERGIDTSAAEVATRDARSRQVENFNPATTPELAFSLSRTLAEVVRTTNKDSVNLNAELLLRTLGRERGRPKIDATNEGESNQPQTAQSQSRNYDDTQAGLNVIRRWLEGAGISTSSFAPRDGSGLSPLNLVTPGATVQMLAYMTQVPTGRIFFESLPRAGFDGTLRGRMGDTEGRVVAKTGALAQTNALSGYATSADGELLIFSIFCNDETGASRTTGTIDRIVTLLARYSEMIQIAPPTTSNIKE
ncbi:MAG: D-alanyl-D-alanine carboxypeptidase/D-alanyl-D-alanine-endopeptidase [Pyrinomonadaceae bacterium MAG19_C2-C3]|nr:D-alanyl-D-alanine carboxypeptidase/D-alanyl-D-alanine-endopeptidase [Pyrinomonadaceae bacterium MAG19_C2-C3]